MISKIINKIRDRGFNRPCLSFVNGFNGVSLISQNCVGGVVYNRLGSPFQSPTINMYILGEDFCKLCEPVEHYLSLRPVLVEEKSISYPVLKIDDIKLHCLHYKTGREAIDAWNRRRKRVNFKRIVVLANDWDLNHNELLINRIIALPYPKIILTANPRYKNNDYFWYIGDVCNIDEKGALSPLPLDRTKKTWEILRKKWWFL